MMGRIVGVLAAAAVALVVAGCQPAPPPGWTPPVVAVTVAPDPIVVGEPFTVEVTATHPSEVTRIGVEIQPPLGFPSGTPFSDVDCEPGAFTPGPTAVQAFECVLVDGAPNGAWRLSAFAWNAGSSLYGGQALSTFQVTGGTDDGGAPVLESVDVSPRPVVIGEPFAVTIRASDEHHLPPSPTSLSANIVLPAPPGGTVAWTCSPVTPTWADETVLEWRFTDCLIPTGSSPWTYAGGIEVQDAIGYRQRLSFSFQAVSG